MSRNPLFMLALMLAATASADEVTVPRGSRLEVTVSRDLRSSQLLEGDAFEARVRIPVRIEGRLAIPEGSRIAGRVTVVKSLASSGVIGVRFASLTTPDGHRYDIDGVLVPTQEGGEPVAAFSAKKKTIVLIGNEDDAGGKRPSTVVGNAGEPVDALAERWSRSGLSPREARVQEGSTLRVELREAVKVKVAP